MAEILSNRRKAIKHLFWFLVPFLVFNLNAQNLRSDRIQKRVAELEKVQKSKPKIVKKIGCGYVISVSNQQEFDGINGRINEALKKGKKKIVIKIRKGIYHFKSNHILRIEENSEDVALFFEGENAIITSDLEHGSQSQLSPWTEVQRAEGMIKVIDAKSGYCFLPFNNIDSSHRQLKKIQITKWFRTGTYDITSIDDKGFYFSAPNLKYIEISGRKGYDINYDYLYSGGNPRFRLYDLSKVDNCNASVFLNISNSSYKSISISGLEFNGNRSSSSLLSFRNVQSSIIRISNCKFINLRNILLSVSNSNNVVFENNKITNTLEDVLVFKDGCKNVWIKNNEFDNCGINLKQTFCVNCGDVDYYIGHNVFRDFGYAAIGVGVLRNKESRNYSGGIIEHNEICFTPNFYANCWKYTLMDSGAIYTWTQNDNVVIRYNYIHDYSGAGDNRGIFCDDGASNISIYKNVIFNISNSYCIDSRQVVDYNTRYKNNANNFIYGNVVDGSIRLMGYTDEDRHVIKGVNYVLVKPDDKPIENKLENLEMGEDDRVISDPKSKIIKKQIEQCLHQ